MTRASIVASKSFTAVPVVSKYRDDIDGLRAVAVLLVILFHFDLTEALSAGFIGVDIFFVISGFLIVPAVVQQVGDQSFQFRIFYAKRIRRLAPPLIATTSLALLTALVVLTPGELKSFSKEVLASQIYASNFYYWRFLNYFGLQADQSFLLHTWSLSVEEQFYLAFPPLIWATAKLWPRGIALVLVVILLGSFALNIVSVAWKPEATFYLLPTRAWEFAAGALTPHLVALASRWRVRSGWLAVAGIGLLGVAFTIYEPTIAFPGVFAVLPVAATVTLLVAGADTAGWWARLMSLRAPVFIGRISYELYLVHWPVRVFAPVFVLDYSIGARVGAIAICFVLAIAIYRLAEVPIRRRRIFARDGALVVAYAGATGALLAIALTIIKTDGLPERLAPKPLVLAAAAADADGSFRHCENNLKDPCLIGNPRARASWIIYGDSHADSLSSSFDDFLRARNSSGYFVFLSGCLPVVASGDSECREFNRKIGHLINDDPEIRNVVIVSTWRQPLERNYSDAAGRVVKGEAALSSFSANLKRTIVERTTGDRRLAVWLPVPGAKRSVPSSLARDAMLGRKWDISYGASEHAKRFRFLTRELAQHPDVTLIRPERRICASGSCRILVGGRPLYHDDAHPAGSQRPFFREIIAEDLSSR